MSGQIGGAVRSRSWPIADLRNVRFPAFWLAARRDGSIWTIAERSRRSDVDARYSRDGLTANRGSSILSDRAVNHPSALAPMLVTATSERYAYAIEVASTTPGLRRECDQFRPEPGIIHNPREFDW